jgi:hypothetical protein
LKTDSDYKEKVHQQLEQYASVELLHKLPAIRDYWFQKFIMPRVRQVFYHDEIRRGNFYANFFERLLRDTPGEPAWLLSLGPGDCKHEVAIVKELRARGFDQFQFECLELSNNLLQMGKRAAENGGVSDLMVFSQGDMNDWNPRREYNGVMAHHALHHFVELEKIFSGIVQCIGTTGIFITCDVIGRNGHLLWPEALAIVESLWSSLRPEKKFHHQFKKSCEKFPNHNCSTKGFEGIRAQDILRLLVENLSFEYFLGYGGLTDPFVGRGFGDNYKAESLEDRTFIDAMQLMNDTLCDAGYLKPTRMMAILRHPGYEGQTRFFRHWSPEFCQRLVPEASIREV